MKKVEFEINVNVEHLDRYIEEVEDILVNLIKARQRIVALGTGEIKVSKEETK